MLTLNKLRTKYNKLPFKKRKYASLILSLIPLKFKYGNVYNEFKEYIHKSLNDKDYVKNYISQKIKYIINKCFYKSEFYRNILKETFGSKFNPENFQIEDFRYLPILKKEIVRKNIDYLITTDKSKLDLITTSGSSGTPLAFYLDKDRSVKEWAFVNYAWSKIGYKPEEHRRAVIRGLDFSDSKNKYWFYDYALRELLLSPFNLEPDIMDLYFDLIYKYKINFIHGYPSAIEILARYATKIGWKPPESFIGILPISEHLTSQTREIINIAFNYPKIMPFYGLSEKVAFASEVLRENDVYEFEPIYGYTELVDDDGKLIDESGKYGRIISTGLISLGMPFIRYDTEDTAMLVRSANYENCYRLRVKNIRSRWNDEYLVTKNNKLISMTALNIHSESYLNIREFQIYQDIPGLAIIKIIPYESINDGYFNKLLNEFQSKTYDNIIFKLEIVKKLGMNERGKRPIIDQRLDINKIKNEHN